MRKALLMAAAIVAATPACAEWTLFGEGEVSGKWFIDHGTIRSTNSNMRRVWVLNDKPKPDKDGDRSGQLFYEIDCPEGRFRVLQYNFYKGPMGAGGSGSSSTRPTDWSYAGPGTIVETLLKTVCR